LRPLDIGFVSFTDGLYTKGTRAHTQFGANPEGLLFFEWRTAYLERFVDDDNDRRRVGRKESGQLAKD